MGTRFRSCRIYQATIQIDIIEHSSSFYNFLSRRIFSNEAKCFYTRSSTSCLTANTNLDTHRPENRTLLPYLREYNLRKTHRFGILRRKMTSPNTFTHSSTRHKAFNAQIRAKLTEKGSQSGQSYTCTSSSCPHLRTQ